MRLAGLIGGVSKHSRQRFFERHRMQHDRFVVFFFWHVSTVVVQTQTLIVSVWTRDAEAAASSDASASCYGVKEDIWSLRLLNRHENSFRYSGRFLLADVVIGADYFCV